MFNSITIDAIFNEIFFNNETHPEMLQDIMLYNPIVHVLIAVKNSICFTVVVYNSICAYVHTHLYLSFSSCTSNYTTQNELRNFNSF